MPDVLFRCSICDNILFAPHQKVGQFIDCPKCNSIIEVPSSSTVTSPECKKLSLPAIITQNVETNQPLLIDKNLKKCPQCAEIIQCNARICKHCKADFTGKGRIRKYVTICFLISLLIVIFFVATTHIIVGKRIGFMIVTRANPGFGEFVINMDEIISMPKMFAVSRYPIGFKVLQREGLIESDEEFRERIKRETQNEIEESLEKIERERAERELQRNEEKHRKEMERLNKYLNSRR